MMHWRPVHIILLGLFLSLLGVALPFLMALDRLPSTFFLNFFSYVASVCGLILGIIGASLYIRKNRNKG